MRVYYNGHTYLQNETSEHVLNITLRDATRELKIITERNLIPI